MSDGSFSLNVPQRDEFAEKLLPQLRRLLGDYGLERRRDGRSLDAYANGARPDSAARVAKVSPEFPPSRFGSSQRPGIKKKNGGGGDYHTEPLSPLIH